MLIREITDPAYRIQQSDNGYTLVWNHAGDAAIFVLPKILLPMECVLLRANVGTLGVTNDSTFSVVACMLDTDTRIQRQIAYTLGQMHCRMWSNPTGFVANWVIAGELTGA